MGEHYGLQDGFIFDYRIGTHEQAYPVTEEDRVIVHSTVVLQEIPDPFAKVDISKGGEDFVEIQHGAPKEGEYRVNYKMGHVIFNPEDEGKEVDITYHGRGVFYISWDRVFTEEDPPGEVAQTLKQLGTVAKELYDWWVVEGVVEDGPDYFVTQWDVWWAEYGPDIMEDQWDTWWNSSDGPEGENGMEDQWTNWWSNTGPDVMLPQWTNWWEQYGPDAMEDQWDTWWNSSDGPEGENGMEDQWDDWFDEAKFVLQFNNLQSRMFGKAVIANAN